MENALDVVFNSGEHNALLFISVRLLYRLIDRRQNTAKNVQLLRLRTGTVK